MRRRNVGIATLLAVCALAACSSSAKSSPTTVSTSTTVPVVTTKPPPTTVPGPPTATMIADVKAYLARAGAPLVKFERATTGVATKRVPTQKECINYFTNILPKISKGPNELISLAQQVPDPALQKYFHDDIGTKDIILLACKARTEPIPAKSMDVIVRQNGLLKARLALYGIAV
jgi:hypothetical protein